MRQAIEIERPTVDGLSKAAQRGDLVLRQAGGPQILFRHGEKPAGDERLDGCFETPPDGLGARHRELLAGDDPHKTLKTRRAATKWRVAGERVHAREMRAGFYQRGYPFL